MQDQDDVNRFVASFKLGCKKCGSDNVVMAYEEGHVYSELTRDADQVTAGCNDCQANDYSVYTTFECQADVDEFVSKYKLCCRKCNSDQVTMAYTKRPPSKTEYDEVISAVCNHCQHNNFESAATLI